MFSQPYTCTLSAHTLNKAEVELHEDPKTRHLEVKTLRERLQQVPGYKGRTDDAFLLRFLRCKKFDQERAFKMVKNFYQVRKDFPDVFDNLTPKRLQHVADTRMIGVLPNRAPDGSKMLYVQTGDWDPDKVPMLDFMAYSVLVIYKLLEEEETQVCGLTVIVELKDFGWRQAKHYTSSVARLEAALYQDCLPLRFKGFHYLNEPKFFDVVWAIAKPFLKEKLLKRVRMHGDKLSSLHEIIPPEILPQELGGKTGPHLYEEWTARLVDSEAQFVEENKYGLVDMTIPAKTKHKADATEALGGTFKKLNVD